MCRVLIVDDDPDFVEITRTILEKEGYQTLTASNGQQALDIMRNDPPDIVLLDIMMRTILDGLYVSREMQTDPRLKNTRVIMVTSIADTPHASEFPTDEYLPIDAWFSKPVNPRELLNTLAKMCTHRQEVKAASS